MHEKWFVKMDDIKHQPVANYMTTFCSQVFGNQYSIMGLHYIAPTAVHTQQLYYGKFRLTIITI